MKQSLQKNFKIVEHNNEEMIKEGNDLLDAVKWLNDELSKTPYMLESFEVEQKKKIKGHERPYKFHK